MLKMGANLTNLLPEKSSASSAVHKIDQACLPTCLTYESASHSEFLISRGYSRFEDFWDLPLIFVDDINLFILITLNDFTCAFFARS